MIIELLILRTISRSWRNVLWCFVTCIKGYNYLDIPVTKRHLMNLPPSWALSTSTKLVLLPLVFPLLFLSCPSSNNQCTTDGRWVNHPRQTFKRPALGRFTSLPTNHNAIIPRLHATQWAASNRARPPCSLVETIIDIRTANKEHTSTTRMLLAGGCGRRQARLRYICLW